jgi:Fe-S-cluster-containing dehydrogenase component
MQNSLPPNDAYIRYEVVESGTYPKVYAEQIPLQCQHCEDAPCVSVCPTGASYINNEGIVLVDRERCIGCKYCMTACPYHARIQDHETGEVEKCRFCVWHDDGSVPTPACVDTCVTNARIFGDLDDPESEISQAIVTHNAKPIAPGLTKAKIYYVR